MGKRLIYVIVSLALLPGAIALADGGTFCNGSNVVEWTCGGESPGGDWVPQGGDCYHRATSSACGSAVQAVQSSTQSNSSGSSAPAYVASVACEAGSDAPSVGANGVGAKTTAEIYAETGKCIPQSTINNNAGKVFWATKGVNLNGTTAEINKAMGWSGTDQHGMIPYGVNSAPATTNFGGAVFGGTATVGSASSSNSSQAAISNTARTGGVNETAINASFGGSPTILNSAQRNTSNSVAEQKAPATTQVNLNRLFSNQNAVGAEASRSPASKSAVGARPNGSGASKVHNAR